MSDIGIVGAGISGLHLALRLRQAGISTTLYAERGPDEIASGRPTNMVARFDNTVARERELGVAHWDSPELGTYGVNFDATGESLGFFGRLSRPCSAVDFRTYLPRLMADYTERGGVMEILAPDAATVAGLAPRHDLVVVASGRRSVTEMFPRDPSRSPYSRPQRVLTVGLYRGIERTPENWVHYQLVPDAGEIFAIEFVAPFLDGVITGINVEAIPGGPLEHLAGLSYQRGEFERALLEVLAEHAPPLRERVDEREFSLARPLDLLQGSITPTVRHGWAELPDGKYAVAVGDAWVVNDPIVGQGANLGSRTAFVLADAIISGNPPYDESFCRKIETQMWECARPVTEWSNAFLAPPPPHALELLGAATGDRRIADAFVDNFDDPAAMWHVLSTPENTTGWLNSLRTP